MKRSWIQYFLWIVLAGLAVSLAVTGHETYDAYATLKADSTSLPNTDVPLISVGEDYPVLPGSAATSSPGFSAISGSATTTIVQQSPPAGSGKAAPVPLFGTIRIPAIGVNAGIERVGINAKGAMAAPKSLKEVAWYGAGPKPGQSGNAVIAGHVDNGLGLAGVFSHLSELKAGDDIYTDETDGSEEHFVVRNIATLDWNGSAAPVFISSDNGSHLVLITCEGTWLPDQKTYSNRHVVYADLVSS